MSTLQQNRPREIFPKSSGNDSRTSQVTIPKKFEKVFPSCKNWESLPELFENVIVIVAYIYMIGTYIPTSI